MAEWYYIGHYGQLGPLTRDQLDELIAGGVVLRETYVWRSGMPSWVVAGGVVELGSAFALAEPFSAPPPPPMAPPPTQNPTQAPPSFSSPNSQSMTPYQSYFPTIPSDRSRVASGILNIVLPGVGRMYLGYIAIGVMQLLLSPCGVGYVWSLIDGIAILCGSTKYDGYGRHLKD